MDTVEFVKNIPAEKVANVFKDYFEQHMLAYDILRGVEFVSLNSIDIDSASIIYSVRLLDTEDKERIVELLNSRAGSLVIYGKHYQPHVFLSGDLLCISINKQTTDEGMV